MVAPSDRITEIVSGCGGSPSFAPMKISSRVPGLRARPASADGPRADG